MIYKMIPPGKLSLSRLEETLNVNVYDNGWGNEQLGMNNWGTNNWGMNNWE
jgi:hypothetical protein